MIEGVARQFVPLLDKFIQIFTRKNFAGRRCFTHKAERGVISAGKTRVREESRHRSAMPSAENHRT